MKRWGITRSLLHSQPVRRVGESFNDLHCTPHCTAHYYFPRAASYPIDDSDATACGGESGFAKMWGVVGV